MMLQCFSLLPFLGRELVFDRIKAASSTDTSLGYIHLLAYWFIGGWLEGYSLPGTSQECRLPEEKPVSSIKPHGLCPYPILMLGWRRFPCCCLTPPVFLCHCQYCLCRSQDGIRCTKAVLRKCLWGRKSEVKRQTTVQVWPLPVEERRLSQLSPEYSVVLGKLQLGQWWDFKPESTSEESCLLQVGASHSIPAMLLISSGWTLGSTAWAGTWGQIWIQVGCSSEVISVLKVLEVIEMVQE